MKKLKKQIKRSMYAALFFECVSSFFIMFAIAVYEGAQFLPWMIVFSLGVLSGCIGWYFECRRKALIKAYRESKRNQKVRTSSRYRTTYLKEVPA